MFKKVLIANRGEIACRIIRTLRRMGIRSVAVYSEADEKALHVKMADEAYLLGPPSVQKSYLNVQALLDVAEKSEAEALHPGYGFLSENAPFAHLVQQKGLVFIGPSPEVISLMGDKLEAKRMAQRAGVSCLPGGEKPLKDLDDAIKVAQEIGYPIMIKAAAGGGGKGMRIVRDSSSLEVAIKGAIHEAQSSFGDGRIFLEKYIDSARHIEIQILADHHGNVIHLGERECSLQRRHQKVIEEAPSPFVTPSLRQQMTEEAIRLAKTMGYTSVGTVEFVVDQDQHFYFLEMNTRLQVEHPTTEMITGLDLVEEMIRVSRGEPLRFQQADIQLKGHAIEARIYAEDSSRGFLPSTGHIRSYLAPDEKEHKIRLDSGIREGDSITPYYDPLMAKLIVHELDRDRACDTLLAALNGFYIRGISTNISFLASLIKAPFFRKNDFDTTTLDQRYGEGFIPIVPENPEIPVGGAAIMYCIRHSISDQDVTVLIDRDSYPVTVTFEGNQFEVKCKTSNKVWIASPPAEARNDEERKENRHREPAKRAWRSRDQTKKERFEETILIIETQWKPGDVLFKGVFNGHEMILQIDPKGIRDELSWSGYSVSTTVVSPRVAELNKYMPLKQIPEVSKIVLAPMPGLVVEVNVAEGDLIKAGQSIVTLEAMKMENMIRAGCDGTVEAIYIKKGDNVNLDQELMKIE